MFDPKVHDTPVSVPARPVEALPEPRELAPERKQPRQSTAPHWSPPPAPLFPEHPVYQQASPPKHTQWREIIRALAIEAVTERKNQIPLALFIVLTILAVVLLGAGARSKPPASQLQEFLTHFTVSSNQTETSLFANDRYLGEIGPGGRQFAVVPGVIRLRVIHSDCRARDTTFEFKAGEYKTVGPLDAACGF